MSASAQDTRSTPLGRLKVYLALSRTPHGVLDLAAPVAAMLLNLGGFPPLWIVLVGLVTVFAGYTAVYAVNDIVDYKIDQAAEDDMDAETSYLDSAFIRHPLAKGRLTLVQAVAWAALWSTVALIGAYSLNPLCAGLFLAGVILETIYCRLLTVSHLRVLVNGVVKTLGPLAAILATDHNPGFTPLALTFLWIFFWEIGGQNIPADWFDLEADTKQGAKTVPVVLGRSKAGRLSLAALAASLLVSVPLISASPLAFPWWLTAAWLIAGAYLTILPAACLAQTHKNTQAATLFNRASLYPALMLAAVLIALLAR